MATLQATNWPQKRQLTVEPLILSIKDVLTKSIHVYGKSPISNDLVIHWETPESFIIPLDGNHGEVRATQLGWAVHCQVRVICIYRDINASDLIEIVPIFPASEFIVSQKLWWISLQPLSQFYHVLRAWRQAYLAGLWMTKGKSISGNQKMSQIDKNMF